MEYETIGGKIIDTDRYRYVLRELKMGDRFTSKSRKRKWEVIGEKCRFNGQAGSATRSCKNLETGTIEHKLCRIEVIKL